MTPARRREIFARFVKDGATVESLAAFYMVRRSIVEEAIRWAWTHPAKKRKRPARRKR